MAPMHGDPWTWQEGKFYICKRGLYIVVKRVSERYDGDDDDVPFFGF